MKEFKDFLKEQREKEKVSTGDWVGLTNGDFGQVFHADSLSIVYESYQHGGLVRATRSSINDTREKFNKLYEKVVKKNKVDSPNVEDNSVREDILKQLHESWTEVAEKKHETNEFEDRVHDLISDKLRNIDGVTRVEVAESDSGFSGTSVNYKIVIEGTPETVVKKNKKHPAMRLEHKPVTIRGQISEIIKSYRGSAVYIKRPERLAESVYTGNVIEVSAILDYTDTDVEKLNEQGIE